MTKTKVFGGAVPGWGVALVLGQLLHLGCSDAGMGDPADQGRMGTGSTPGTSAGGGVGVSGPGAGGSVGAGAAGPGAGGGSVTDPGSGGGAGEGMPAIDAPSASFVRRLTHVEYDNTIVDLLGVDLNPSANFETDLAQDGFTNNAAAQNVSPTLTEQYMVASETISEAATESLNELLGCDPGALGEETCVKQFIADFGKRAWRRPLTTEEEGRLFELFTNVRPEFELDESIQMVIQVFLQSPHFIYLLEPNPEGTSPGDVEQLDPYRMATRLAYFLLGSMPDAELFEAADAGELDTAEGVAAQAARLLTLPRARDRIAQFFEEWLRLRSIERLQKDTTQFPDFDLSLAPLMLEQVERFTQSIILDEDGTATDLLTASYSFLSPELAPYYDKSMPSTPYGEFERVEFEPGQRAGLLTHIAVLANFAHNDQTDPVHRGKFVRTGLLCDAIPPPPPDIVIQVPVVEPGATTRERFNKHQEEPACAKCHTFMDPIGLGFEHYDAMGQWRDEDNGLPIDATGEIVGSDVEGMFDGAVELANKLAESEQVMNCMARTWLRFALGRSDLDADAGAVEAAGAEFEENGYVIKELLVALTKTNTFRFQRVLDPNKSFQAEENP